MASEEELPAWIKASDRGSLGEARARAFLMQRFWIFERSIDQQGADIIIQRRSTVRNLLDDDPPRFGVVQVKSFGTPATSHFIKREYVIDERGRARSAFFVICDTSTDNELILHVVLGEEIPTAFPEGLHGSPGFVMAAKALTASNQFRVVSPRHALNRIEERIKFAEVAKTKALVSWMLSSTKPDLGVISPLYREPLDNWRGDDLFGGFKKVKSAAWQGMQNLEEIYQLLSRVVQEADPTVAEAIIAEIEYHCRSGYGWSVSIPDEINGADLFSVCRRHRRIIETLRSDGLLDAFHKLRDGIRSQVIGALEPLLPVPLNLVQRFEVKYVPSDFTLLQVESQFINVDQYELKDTEIEDVEAAEAGRIVYRWMPGRHTGHKNDDSVSLEDWYYSTNFYWYYTCLDKIFELKYGA